IVQGGSDIGTVGTSGFELLSIERNLFAVFPAWVAILVHKALVFSVGFWGAYLLARRVGECEQGIAVAIGIIYLFSFWTFTDQTLMNGLGRLINPLAIFVMVSQLGRPNYARNVGLFALLAMTVEPTHSLLSMLLAILVGWAILSRKHFLRLFAATSFLGIPYLINWHEVLYGYIAVINHTFRSKVMNAEATFVDLSLTNFETTVSFNHTIGSILHLGNFFPFWLFLGALIVLFIHHKQSFYDSLLGFGVFSLFYILLNIMDWNALGLGILNSLSKGYAKDAFFAFALIAMAQSAQVTSKANGLRLPLLSSTSRLQQLVLPRTILPAIALAALVGTKAHHAIYFVQYGGQSYFHSISNLAKPDWAAMEPFKTVTLWDGKFTPTLVPGFYGIGSVDTQLSNYLVTLSSYWWYGLQAEDMGSFQTVLPRNMAHWSKTDKKYDIGKHGVSMPLLGAANVRYFLSPLPLKGGGLKQVSGPPEGTPVHIKPQSASEVLPYVLDRIDKSFDYGEFYIYELPDYLPRVYGANKTVFVSSELNDIEYFNKLEEQAFEKNVVLRENRTDVLPLASDSLKVTEFQLVKDGFDISVDAPDGGVVIVNTPWVVFWKSWADGAPVRNVEVNGIQTGIEVPSGTQQIQLRYCRPSTKNKITELLGGEALCSNSPKD
ncbi:MAG: hypothetical protein ISR45_09940, partial [Rhodospirillales bacterium]|nr:hypothetical protein [Rhodospirillales bacterium]